MKNLKDILENKFSKNFTILEKLKINKETDFNLKDADEKLYKNVYWRMDHPDWKDNEKMKNYHDKGSKPERLVATIKDRDKLCRRFLSAFNLDWIHAIKVFGDAIVDRGYFTREEIDNFIAYKEVQKNEK